MRVMFLRVTVEAAPVIEEQLAKLYANGWRVVSHAESDGEYSFVLEQPVLVGLNIHGV